MRILHVIPAVAARYGGPSSSIVEMCRALAEHGLKPMILATDADGDGRLPVPNGVLSLWQGVDAIFFERQWSEAFKYSRPLAVWLDQHVREFSVVHIHGLLSHAPLAAASACRRGHVPYIVRPLGTLDPWSLRHKGIRKQLLLSLGAQHLLRGAAAIQCTSEEEKRAVESAVNVSRGIVIPLGVDSGLLAASPLPMAERMNDPYVLALSRLHPVKNLEALIDAFGDVTDNGVGSDWRLIIGGSGDDTYAARLEQVVQRRQLSRRVKFAGWVDGDAKRRLLRHASLFALPSLHENFGVSLVEALALSVPALVSDQVHLAGMVGQANAGWVTSVDRASIARGLSSAIDSVDDRSIRGLAARELARRFAWPVVASQLTELYEKISERDRQLAAGGVAAGTALRDPMRGS